MNTNEMTKEQKRTAMTKAFSVFDKKSTGFMSTKAFTVLMTKHGNPTFYISPDIINGDYTRANSIIHEMYKELDNYEFNKETLPKELEFLRVIDTFNYYDLEERGFDSRLLDQVDISCGKFKISQFIETSLSKGSLRGNL